GAPPPPRRQAEREVLLEHIMQPGTGKAVEVLEGQILRIEQLEGPQCVDFNCFNLHDYKEAMHAGRIRAVHGLRPTAGHFIWSAPPRERAMMYFLADTTNCNDVLFSRCSAYLYESMYGFAAHTNCHDIQAEAQREYGLTPDDAHDSLNFFMCTGVSGDQTVINRQHSKPGDHVELLALMDVLAVPNVCGNDVGRTSNFCLKPVRLLVLQATAEDMARVPPLKTYPTNLRSPENFRQPNIKADRPLRRDPNYAPEFTNVPLRIIEVEVPLDDEEYARLRQCGLEEYYGEDEAAMLRDLLLSWWERTFTANLPGTHG
ncbi:MAG TPA: urea carboxylase-associated family protein, partial [Pseudaminobacter sp.]|nr:urea carboxylase-associated family protein [Pseudaminobacter sp.]